MNLFTVVNKPLRISGRLFFYGLLLGGLTLVNSCQKEKNTVIPFEGTITLVFGEDGHHTGYGTASHIGKYTFISTDDESNFPNITGTMDITIANGDHLFVTHTGIATELKGGELEADFNNTITGGTGKYDGATGNFVTKVMVDESLPTAEGTIKGVIYLK
jgi:hypothetical protein